MITEKEINDIIVGFRTRTLPKEQFTHLAHLIVGLDVLTAVPVQSALPIMRTNICAYNESVGGKNTDHAGYHETITRFFLEAQAEFMWQNKDAQSFVELVARLQGSVLTERPFMFQFYSKERLFSVEARRGWLSPDLQPLSELANISFCRQNSLHDKTLVHIADN